MRGKLAKQLRRLAELNTVGKPDRAYTTEPMNRYTVRLVPGCLRHELKRLKAVLHGSRG